MSVGDLCPVLFFHTSIEPNALSSGSVREFNFAGFSSLRALARRVGTTDRRVIDAALTSQGDCKADWPAGGELTLSTDAGRGN